VAGKNRAIAAALALITVSQLALGIYRTFLAATHAGRPWVRMFSGPISNISTGSQRRPPPRFRLTASRYVFSLATGKWRSPILWFHWDMVRNSKIYPVSKWLYHPFLEDLLAFLIILHLAARWTTRRFGIPGLLGTILRDATKYFLVIFTAHFVFVMTLLFARVSSVMGFANHDDAKTLS